MDDLNEQVKCLTEWHKNGFSNPISIEIFLTRKCNLLCRFCQSENNKPFIKKELSYSRLSSLVKQSAGLGIKKIFFTGGGEPAVRKKELLKLMGISKKLGMCGHLITNGTLLGSEDAEKIVKIKWDELVISLHGPDAVTDEYLRGVKGSFDKTVNFLQAIKEYKQKFKSEYPMVIFNYVLTNRNYKKIEDMLRLANKLGVKGFTIQSLMITFPEVKRLQLSKKQINEFRYAIKKNLKLSESYGMFTNLNEFEESKYVEEASEIFKLLIKTGGSGLVFAPCYVPWYGITITSEGNVGPCAILAERSKTKIKKSLKYLWTEDYFKEIRNKMLVKDISDFCKTCCIGKVFENREVRKRLRERVYGINSVHNFDGIKNNVILLNLNGGSWRVINYLIRNKKLPNFKFLKKNGAYGKIIPIKCYVDPEAENFEIMEETTQWACFSTGVGPEKHGVTTFSSTSNSYRVKTIWDYVYESGKKVGIINWLNTWPPIKYDYYCIPGWAPGNDIYPKNLKKDLENIIISVPDFNDVKNLRYKKIFENEFREIRKVKSYYYYLRKKYTPDLIMIGLFGADHIQHDIWKYFEPFQSEVNEEERSTCCKYLFKYYEEIDEFVGELLKEGATLIITSEHDFARKFSSRLIYFFKVNNFLEKLGFLKNSENITSSETIYSPFEGLHINVYKTIEGDIKVQSEVRNLILGSKKKGSDYEHVVSKFISTLSKVKFEDKKLFLMEKINRGDGNIKFSFNSQLIEKLLKNSKLEDVEIKAGNANFRLGDCLVRFFHTGEHDNSSGVFIAYGNGIKKNYKISDISPLCILPTILKILNTEVPSNLEGFSLIQDS